MWERRWKNDDCFARPYVQEQMLDMNFSNQMLNLVFN